MLPDDLALVQTVDFFAPIVDDPYTFGQIAAANALSDVFAMGGEPITALNIVGFPAGQAAARACSPRSCAAGRTRCTRPGAVVVGGHTIIDEELKYGLAVTGRGAPASGCSPTPRRGRRRAGAHEAARHRPARDRGEAGKLGAADSSGAVRLDAHAEREAGRAALALGVRCATDVTGFGLLGQPSHIARASGVIAADRRARTCPSLPGRARGVERGATHRRRRAERGVSRRARSTGAPRAARSARSLVDPQTSGGLLRRRAPPRVAEYLSRVRGAT